MLARSPRRPLLWAAFLFVISSPATFAQATDLAASQWNQAHANHACTAAVDVEPIRAEPVTAWRYDEHPLACAPVAWGNVVFAVVDTGRGRKLLALDLESGERLASTRVSKSAGDVSLAAWLGTVILCGETGMQMYTLTGKSLKRGRLIKGSFGAPPSVFRGLAFACDNQGLLHCIELQTGKIRSTSPAGRSTPSLVFLDATTVEVTTLSHENDDGSREAYLARHANIITGLDGKPAFKSQAQYAIGPITTGSSTGALHEARTAPIGDTQNLYVFSKAELRGDDGATYPSLLVGIVTGTRLLPLAEPAAITGDMMYGFSDKGALLQVTHDGRYVELVEGTKLPNGARPGPASVARDVLYLGNWAIEMSTRRVLWTLPDVAFTTPLMPVADGRAIAVDTQGALVCLAAPGEPEAARVTRRITSLPGDGTGVVLADGERLRGSVERLSDGSVRVTSDDGEERTLEARSLALIESADAVERVGDEFPVFVATWEHLSAQHVTRLEQLFEDHARNRFLSECQRLLAEAREYGMDETRIAELERSVAGKSQNTANNADKQLARLARGEMKVRAAGGRDVLDAAQWCAEHDLPGAASALLAEGGTMTGDDEPFVERAQALIPDAFPFTSQTPARAWLLWNRELLPAGARFVRASDEAWGRAEGAIWRKDTILLRTDNLLFFSRTLDPAIVGACLRNGEGALRMLTQLLPPDEGVEQTRLDVRVHATRADYLAEAEAQQKDIAWSAGHYSPLEGVSRFFVPQKGDGRDAGLAGGSTLGRDLFKVLVHELTHHYVAERWIGPTSMGATEPGYWAVEGLARFVEDQVVELGRRGRGLDDRTVASLDAMHQASKTDTIIPIEALIDMPQTGFQQLGREPTLEIQLRNTIERHRLSATHIFYEQSGSLVFFLMNEQGPETRERFLTYLRKHYMGRAPRRGWRALGFDSAEQLAIEFREFLASL